MGVGDKIICGDIHWLRLLVLGISLEVPTNRHASHAGSHMGLILISMAAPSLGVASRATLHSMGKSRTLVYLRSTEERNQQAPSIIAAASRATTVTPQGLAIRRSARSFFSVFNVGLGGLPFI